MNKEEIMNAKTDLNTLEHLYINSKKSIIKSKKYVRKTRLNLFKYFIKYYMIKNKKETNIKELNKAKINLMTANKILNEAINLYNVSVCYSDEINKLKILCSENIEIIKLSNFAKKIAEKAIL